MPARSGNVEDLSPMTNPHRYQKSARQRFRRLNRADQNAELDEFEEHDIRSLERHEQPTKKSRRGNDISEETEYDRTINLPKRTAGALQSRTFPQRGLVLKSSCLSKNCITKLSAHRQEDLMNASTSQDENSSAEEQLSQDIVHQRSCFNKQTRSRNA